MLCIKSSNHVTITVHALNGKERNKARFVCVPGGVSAPTRGHGRGSHNKGHRGGNRGGEGGSDGGGEQWATEVQIVQALYGLRSSGVSFDQAISDSLRKMG